MGYGIIIIPILAILYIPILVFSIDFYRKSKPLAISEEEAFTNPKSFKRTIVFIYIIMILLTQGKITGNIIGGIVQQDIGLFGIGIKRAFGMWDSVDNIFQYWAYLLLTFLFIEFIRIIFENPGEKLKQYNKYILSIFNLCLQPLIITSFLIRIFRWDQPINNWLQQL